MEIEYRSDKILKLRVFRVKHRISLAELAQASSVSIQRISQIELMDCPLTPHIEEQLTRALEVVLLRRNANAAAAIADYRQAAALQPKPRYTDPWDSVAQLSRLSQDRAGEAEAYERIIDILQTDWGLGECETVQGYRENLKACR